MRHYATLVLLGLLVAGTILQGYGRSARRKSVSNLQLDMAIPAQLDGWVVQNESLGLTEAGSAYAAKELQFDDCVYRSFSTPAVSFSIYAAHWSPGRMSWQDVATHTPDTCWTANGWTCIERVSRYALGWDNVEFAKGKWRKFIPPQGRSMEVLFWHVAGNRVVAYDAEERLSGLRESVRQLFSPKTDQYFIRVSSTTAITELKKDPGFRRAFSGFGQLLQRQNFQ